MRFASLGSGSRGNALVVEGGGSRVLVDCGFGPRTLTTRLARLGLVPGDIDALLLTHEHSDHVAGVAKCVARFGYPVYATHGTRRAARLESLSCTLLDSHSPLAIGGLEIRPFPVPHDACEPVQFVISDGRRRCGILTDTGFATPHMADMLSACDGLVLECNHDEEMLARGDYPALLKKRIAGRDGHLSNAAAAALLRTLDTGGLQHLVAAHLSQQNNRPALAQAALAAVLGCDPSWIAVADQEQGFSWRDLR